MASSSQASTRKSIYGVHPGVQMVQDWIAGLKEKTGHTLEEWIALVKKSGPAGEEARREWLKKEHKFGTNAAWWIAERASGKGSEEDTPEKYLRAAEKYVEEMFAGGKAGLRPIYDALLSLGLSTGTDVKACPCKTIVPLYRKHVFAQIKPTTRTRIDFGLCLRGVKPPKRLIDTGGAAKGDRITHRIEISSLKDIDAEVKRWLKTAYEQDT
ncbi:MAG TPA: DUF5655 domain-containing protein [Candidatus Acidoferrales bacterium]|jgi:hypothetical protein|nr:DUF5655 domain-containing protein [Candidatus Acidoferrales bacterium]